MAELGRRASLRGCWEPTPVEVRVLSPAPECSRKWCSGSTSPCQGEGRGFESRLPLHGDVAKRLRRGSAKPLSAVRIRPSPPITVLAELEQILGPSLHTAPEWRNRQTRRSQKPLRLTPRVGSSPSSGTPWKHILITCAQRSRLPQTCAKIACYLQWAPQLHRLSFTTGDTGRQPSTPPCQPLASLRLPPSKW